MAMPQNLVKAEMQEITWTEQQIAQTIGQPVKVQFNPESLKVSFSMQKAGGDQRGGSATQFVGQGTTRLSFDLWFDVTAPDPDAARGGENDVRKLTEKVAYFITPNKKTFIAPGVRFAWGTFLFEGIMESLNETLEYFSEDGRPLRAQLSLGLTRQEIQFQFGTQASPGLGSTPGPGTLPLKQAKAGDSVQLMAGLAGKQDQWPRIADLNGIENPRHLLPGTPLNMNVNIPGPSNLGLPRPLNAVPSPLNLNVSANINL